MKTTLRTLSLLLCLTTTVSCQRLMADDEDATFEYREIYLPENNTKEGRQLGLNQVDQDWGLWGHNLQRTLPESPSHAIYATIGGRSDERQYCFSSDQLYTYIEQYISDNYGKHKSVRFAILPNDNSLVCQCPGCVEKGCTPTDASPAVNAMIRRLASRFPRHIFFTSHYLTTSTLPAEPMPENTGVLISAMAYPLCAEPTPEEAKFEQLLRQWGQMSQHVYVWDYINNFDDYFTPFPVVAIMQHRLSLYAKAGVRGVFLNGSGTDYSCLSKVRTHVLAALTKNPGADWRQLIDEKCHEFYPMAGEELARYLIQLEESAQACATPLPLYQGVPVAVKTYLDKGAFFAFHEALGRLLPRLSGQELTDISLLHRTLMLTRLELKRLQGDVAGTRPLLEELASVVDDGVRIYSESFWTVESYVADYHAMAKEAKTSRKKNKLQGQTLIPLTALDSEYSDLSILTDGLPGLPSNYHCGQLLSSADPWLRLAIPNPAGELKRLRVGFTSNVQFHIALPERVTLTCGEREVGTIVPQSQGNIGQRTYVEFSVPSWADGTLVLTVVRNKEERTMALDEIEGF